MPDIEKNTFFEQKDEIMNENRTNETTGYDVKDGIYGDKKEEEADEYISSILVNFKSENNCITNEADILKGESSRQKERMQINILELFSCNICSTTYRNKRLLYFHNMRVHCEPVTCSLCGKIFRNKKQVSDHKKIVHDGLRHRCIKCGKGLRKLDNLKYHEKLCGNMRRSRGSIPCQVCGKTFSTEYNLHTHQGRQHIVSSSYNIYEDLIPTDKKAEEEIDCMICWKTFKKMKYLSAHLSKVHNIGDLEAMKITKQENALPEINDQLILEISKHTFGHICSICQNLFKTTKSLRKHKGETHAGQKPFQCSLCKSNFEKHSFLLKHSKNVHIKRNYSCPFCSHKFKINSNLQSHIKNIHTNNLVPQIKCK